MSEYRRHVTAQRDVYMVGEVAVTQEFDDYGAHRIRIGSRSSQWVGYTGISVIGNYRGVSEYYAGNLPVVFKIIKGKLNN